MIGARSAEIIAVGSELLTPFRLDTNSLWLTGRLDDLGLPVRHKTVVGDDLADLQAAVRTALGRADVVITTGGLGPTSDDLTRDAVAAVLGLPLTEDAATLERIRERFARRGVEMPAVNRRQALVPRGATLLPNANGTAPGIFIETAEGDRVVVLLPGPPRELQPMFDAAVVPRLAPLGSGHAPRRRVLKITGRTESQVEELAHPIYSTLGGPRVTVATSILASSGLIEIHLVATGPPADADRLLDDGVTALERALAPAVYSLDGRALEVVVGDALRARGWRVAAAESCTGGLLLGRLTEVPGSSDYVLGGVVAYDNAVKVALLDVPQTTLAAHGAVSEPVGRAMAEGARRRFGADLAVAVTGIAGPGGGSDAKPVGTVVVALDGPHPVVRTLRLPGDRAMVRALSVNAALDLIRRACAGA
ncbi:MAG: competence/damage-inducible protein A [Vicinamibacterales bacterium]